ncbi:hypothetical protein PPERSA_06376 [Pseudocohnilembus persalinus]|uniref:Uncharacterized protein n=1 Tax=Pseudocohnilembus persalinus TaxID=266149 RepID=A0A0V0QJJ8_PSEPJ|nr:hypothetical protein PPERSA_06376 [Pseudocohnilembus persalinus]|eukprot:KRX02181.1 hypothetical protein PPERSA_06376 [Pseudocohnilembus persalinus]
MILKNSFKSVGNFKDLKRFRLNFTPPKGKERKNFYQQLSQGVLDQMHTIGGLQILELQIPFQITRQNVYWEELNEKYNFGKFLKILDLNFYHKIQVEKQDDQYYGLFLNFFEGDEKLHQTIIKDNIIMRDLMNFATKSNQLEKIKITSHEQIQPIKNNQAQKYSYKESIQFASDIIKQFWNEKRGLNYAEITISEQFEIFSKILNYYTQLKIFVIISIKFLREKLKFQQRKEILIEMMEFLPILQKNKQEYKDFHYQNQIKNQIISGKLSDQKNQQNKQQNLQISPQNIPMKQKNRDKFIEDECFISLKINSEKHIKNNEIFKKKYSQDFSVQQNQRPGLTIMKQIRKFISQENLNELEFTSDSDTYINQYYDNSNDEGGLEEETKVESILFSQTQKSKSEFQDSLNLIDSLNLTENYNENDASNLVSNLINNFRFNQEKTAQNKSEKNKVNMEIEYQNQNQLNIEQLKF